MFARANQQVRHMKGVSYFLVKVATTMCILLTMIGSGLFIQNVYGATVPSGTVKAKSGYVRTGTATSTDIAFCVKNGEEVAILATEKGKDGSTWYKVSVGESVGYIRSDLISKSDKKIKVSDSLVAAGDSTQASSSTTNNKENTKTEEKSQDTTNKDNGSSASQTKGSGTPGVINASSVRVRSMASVNSSLVKHLDKGALVTISGEGKAQDGHIWYQVRVGDDIGFVRSDYINKVDTTQSDNSDKATEETKTENKDETKTEDKTQTENKTGDSTQTTQQATTDAASTEAKETQTPSEESGVEGVVKGTAVRVRDIPVTGSIVCQLSNGHPIKVVEEQQADDSNVWFKIEFSYMGNTKTGYIRSDFVTKAETTKSNEETETVATDEDFEGSIGGFPDSYKNALRTLHNAHPNWKFELVNTGLDWNAALTAESSVGKNLVEKNSVASWKSTATQAYNSNSNTWYTFDGGNWVSASSEIIAYYMDPRNFLDDSGIYQFECLDYNESQNVDATAKVLAGTFMSANFADTDGTTNSYADIFTKAGQAVGVSPYLLASRAVQEQGVNGTSQSIAGNVAGYEGLFNYYNVGAYAYGGRSATINGLVYAKGSDDNSLRPWNTRVKSIAGGAKYIADNYIKKGQNTLYFQKFNVVNSENTIYSHQYMSYIQAPSSEAARLKLAYTGEESLTFRIPVYNNMPQSLCAKPTSDASPNAYLESISIDCGELTPVFSGAIEKYAVTAAPDKDQVTVSAKAVSEKSTIEGEGTYNLKDGENVVTLTVKSQSGAVKKYTITISK